MFRLSKVTDYGIVLLAQLARSEDRSAQNAHKLALEVELPVPMVSKILKSLARSGLLLSHRGAKGGYTLARPADAITVAEMIAVLEGPIALTECTQHPGACIQEPNCQVREPWQRINQVVKAALANITLADLVASEPGTLIPLSILGVDPTGIEPLTS